MINACFLNDRKIITIKGDDRYNFLQGLITNDIFKVNSERSIYSCLLTPQGKYFADLFISTKNNEFLVEVPTNKKDELLKKFKLYKLRSKIEITDSSDLYHVYSVSGSGLNGKCGENIKFDTFLAFIDPRNENLGLRIFVNAEEKSIFEQKYALSETSYEEIRINTGIAEGEKDMISDKSFPLEFGLEKLSAIDFKKGCYVGQELVSRTFYRGVVRKKIYIIKSDEHLPPHGNEIMIADKKIGIICSSFKNIGLALIREEDYLANSLNGAAASINGINISIAKPLYLS